MACEVLDLMNGQLVMNEIKLNFSSGYTAGYLFFQSMWEYLQDKMSDQDKDDFGMLMAGAYGVPGWDVDWEKAVVKFYGEQIDKSKLIPSREIFKIVIQFLALFKDEFGFPCPFLINLLQNMLEKPDKYLTEWNMWRAAAAKASTYEYREHGQWN